MKFLFLTLLGVLAVSSAGAVEVTSLYTAQVPLDQEQDDPRAHASEIALAQVLLRVSGPSLVSDRERFDALFPQPSSYVVQFRRGRNGTIFVSFDGEAVEDALRSAGQTVWGSERPLTLIWLAVDWGQGEREIVGASDVENSADAARSINRHRMLRQRLLNFAASRGLPIAFPLLDTEDLANLSFSDVWGGFDERILEASRRYDVNSILVGRVRAESGRRNRWTYHFAGEQRNWGGEPEIALMQIADLLAAEFSIGGDLPLRTVQLNVSGITSVDVYGRVQSALAGMNVVEDFAVATVAGDRISFRVDAHGGAARLARALRFEGFIEEQRVEFIGVDDASRPQVPDVTEGVAELDFFFNP